MQLRLVVQKKNASILIKNIRRSRLGLQLFTGHPTRLARPADCSEQTCWLGSADLPSLVTTFKKLYPCTPEDGFFHSRRRIRSPNETYSFIQRDVFFHLKRRIIQGTKTHPSMFRLPYFYYSNRFFTCTFKTTISYQGF